MSEGRRRPGERGLAATALRFAFPGSLLAAALLIHTGWIGNIGFLGAYVQWKQVQAFLSQNNEGFFLTALLGFYLEVMRPNTFSGFFRTRLEALDAFLASASAVDGTRFFLRQHHGATERHLGVEQLADTIVSDKPTLTNGVVAIALRQAPPAGIQQRYLMNYDADVSTAVLAVARTPALQARLLALFPEILEALVLDHQADFPAACRELLASSPITVDNSDLDFKPIALDRDPRLEKVAGGTRGVDWEIYAAPVERKSRGKAPSFSVELKVMHPDTGGGVAHWLADRPMHVRRIEIDVTGLQPGGPAVFSLIPFIGEHDGIRGEDFATGRCTLLVNRWLVHGQGVCLAWHRRAGAAPPVPGVASASTATPAPTAP